LDSFDLKIIGDINSANSYHSSQYPLNLYERLKAIPVENIREEEYGRFQSVKERLEHFLYCRRMLPEVKPAGAELPELIEKFKSLAVRIAELSPEFNFASVLPAPKEIYKNKFYQESMARMAREDFNAADTKVILSRKLDGIKIEKRAELMESLLERIGQKDDLKSLDIFMGFYRDLKGWRSGFKNILESRGILGKMANMREEMLSKIDIPGTIRFLR
jgi:hypothetical protein